MLANNSVSTRDRPTRILPWPQGRTGTIALLNGNAPNHSSLNREYSPSRPIYQHGRRITARAKAQHTTMASAVQAQASPQDRACIETTMTIHSETRTLKMRINDIRKTLSTRVSRMPLAPHQQRGRTKPAGQADHQLETMSRMVISMTPIRRKNKPCIGTKSILLWAVLFLHNAIIRDGMREKMKRSERSRDKTEKANDEDED